MRRPREDIDILKKRAPNHPQVNYAQGLIHFNNNRLAEARDAFALTLRSSNDSHLQATFYMALTQMYLGNQQQAKHYGNNFSGVSQSISGRKLMASIEFRDQHYAEAEELIRPVMAIQEDDVAALDLLANALLGQGKMDEAIELLVKVASLQPDSADAQFRLGVGLSQMVSNPRALNILRMPARWTPNSNQQIYCWCRPIWNRRNLIKRW